MVAFSRIAFAFAIAGISFAQSFTGVKPSGVPTGTFPTDMAFPSGGPGPRPSGAPRAGHHGGRRPRPSGSVGELAHKSGEAPHFPTGSFSAFPSGVAKPSGGPGGPIASGEEKSGFAKPTGGFGGEKSGFAKPTGGFPGGERPSGAPSDMPSGAWSAIPTGVEKRQATEVFSHSKPTERPSDAFPSGAAPSGAAPPHGAHPTGARPSGPIPSGAIPSHGARPSGARPSAKFDKFEAGQTGYHVRPTGFRPSGVSGMPPKPTGSRPAGLQLSGAHSRPAPSGFVTSVI